MYILKNLASDLFSLLFPRLCCACGTPLFTAELQLCLHCLYDLPYTDYHLYQDNRVVKQLWGRIQLQSGMALLHFKKGSSTQQIIHQLKYKGQTSLGHQLGELIGARMIQNPEFIIPDYIIPVPLHRSKLAQRGYNQCDCIAGGIAAVLQIPVLNNTLIKHKKTGSQTRRGRFSRYENLSHAFAVPDAAAIQNRHVLLVDDVITTGATIEACALELFKQGIKSLSVAAIAFAD